MLKAPHLPCSLAANLLSGRVSFRIQIGLREPLRVHRSVEDGKKRQATEIDGVRASISPRGSPTMSARMFRLVSSEVHLGSAECLKGNTDVAFPIGRIPI